MAKHHQTVKAALGNIDQRKRARVYNTRNPNSAYHHFFLQSSIATYEQSRYPGWTVASPRDAQLEFGARGGIGSTHAIFGPRWHGLLAKLRDLPASVDGGGGSLTRAVVMKRAEVGKTNQLIGAAFQPSNHE